MFLIVYILKLLSLLPLKVLSLLEPVIYFIMFRVMGYRRVMVNKNMSLSFPDKTSAFLWKLEKDFYKNFATTIVEIIKSLSISNSEIIERVKLNNEQILEKYRTQNRPVIVMTAHYGNWEWAAKRMGLIQGFNHFCFYRPQSFKSIDRLLLKSRKSTGVNMITEQHALKLRHFKNKPTIIATLGDHSPATINKVMWLPFLHQESAFLSGPAKLAKIIDAVVLYAEIKPVRKGYYSINFEVLSENSHEETEMKIIGKYVHCLEQVIERKPQFWLWSHNRWKRKPQKSN